MAGKQAGRQAQAGKQAGRASRRASKRAGKQAGRRRPLTLRGQYLLAHVAVVWLVVHQHQLVPAQALGHLGASAAVGHAQGDLVQGADLDQHVDLGAAAAEGGDAV